MSTSHAPKDYKCIAIWGGILGSYPNYISTEQYRAAMDNAPLTAVYFNDSLGVWVVAEDIASPDTRSRVINALAKEAIK